MSLEILVPSLPESVSDATLASWHKKPGEFVNKDDNLVDLETDKIVLEVPAPESGVLTEILQQDGATVVAGDVLALLEVKQQDDTVAQAAETEHAEAEELPLSPAVRRILQENNIDPQDLHGSGKKGRLTKTDVLEYIDEQKAQQQPVVKTTEPEKVKVIEPEKPVSSSFRPEQRVPMTRLRAKVAERLLQAQQNAAMLTTFNEVNMQSVINLRNQYKERFQLKHDIKLGFMSFFIKASIEALKKYPAVNASIDDKDIIYHGYYDMGIAVSTERGLIVPVIRDADQLDFAGIEKSIFDYGTKAR